MLLWEKTVLNRCLQYNCNIFFKSNFSRFLLIICKYLFFLILLSKRKSGNPLSWLMIILCIWWRDSVKNKHFIFYFFNSFSKERDTILESFAEIWKESICKKWMPFTWTIVKKERQKSFKFICNYEAKTWSDILIQIRMCVTVISPPFKRFLGTKEKKNLNEPQIFGIN